MGRVEAASGNEGSAEDRAAFREVQARLGQAFFTEKTKYPPSELFGPLLHAPRMTRALLELGGSLRNLGEAGADGGAALPDAFAEFVAFVVFAELEREAVAGGVAFAYRRPMLNHVPRAIRSGMRAEAIEALRAHDDAALLPRELELARFVRAVLAGDVEPGCWAAMQARVGTPRTLETAAYALLDFLVCRLEAALGLADASGAELEAAVKECARTQPGAGDLSL